MAGGTERQSTVGTDANGGAVRIAERAGAGGERGGGPEGDAGDDGIGDPGGGGVGGEGDGAGHGGGVAAGGGGAAEEGNTEGGVEALQKAHELAERVWTAKKDPAALESKAVSLPLLALALQSRRDSDESMAVARRAIAVQGEYRRVFGRPLGPANPYYRLILQVGPALARRGETDAGRGLLLEALGVAREAGVG